MFSLKIETALDKEYAIFQEISVSTPILISKKIIEISPAIQAYQTKFCVFLEKIWVNAQTVVSSNAMTTVQRHIDRNKC